MMGAIRVVRVEAVVEGLVHVLVPVLSSVVNAPSNCTAAGASYNNEEDKEDDSCH
jgi:hypothetical protein